MVPTTDTVANLFERAIAAEKAARGLYLAFAERFSEPPAVSAFWRSLADDELDHVEKLEQIYDGLSAEQRDAPADPEALRQARRLEALIPDDAVDRVSTLKEAFWLAHDLEHSEVNTIFDFILTQFVDSKDQQEFALMQLQNHVSKLVEPSAVRDLVWQES